MKDLITNCLLALFLFIVFCGITILVDVCIVKADDIEIQEVSINYKSFFPGGSDPLITQNGLGHFLDKQLDLRLNMDIYTHFYWNNTIHSMTDSNVDGNGQFRLVGWNFMVGAHITDNIDFGYYHFSQHLLDYGGAPGYHFPVVDAWEINWIIFRPRNPGKGIF